MLSLSPTSSHSENEEPLVDHLKAALAVEHVSIASRVSSPLLSDGFVLVFAVVGSAPGAAAPLKKCPAFAHDRGYENIVERCAYAAWNADKGRVVAANELFSVWNGAAVTPQRVLDLYAAKCRVSESNGAPTIGSAPGKAAHSGHVSDDKSGMCMEVAVPEPTLVGTDASDSRKLDFYVYERSDARGSHWTAHSVGIPTEKNPSLVL